VTRLTAVVSASGSIARSQGTTSAGRIGPGQYEVIFTQNVTECTYLATAGLQSGGGVASFSQVFVLPRAGNANGVSVNTSNSAGALADRTFHLAVIC
jgi:hypothetical protein